jgi:hypothetical protein
MPSGDEERTPANPSDTVACFLPGKSPSTGLLKLPLACIGRNLRLQLERAPHPFQ